jgi:hypothetical protein
MRGEAPFTRSIHGVAICPTWGSSTDNGPHVPQDEFPWLDKVCEDRRLQSRLLADASAAETDFLLSDNSIRGKMTK